MTAVELAPPPPEAARVFADAVPLAQRYATLLATTGVTHGLLGPREVPRLWDRHLLNCAVVADLIPEGVTVVDVGSGAGLPGLALAIARPDLRVVLIEPMLRRTTWLSAAVEQLDLGDRVEVHRGRAEAFWGTITAPVVTARAVARLGELALWCLPLVAPGGCVLAIKGSGAQDEIDEAAQALRGYGVCAAEVVVAGDAILENPTTVVRLRVGDGGARVPQASVAVPGRSRKVTTVRGARRRTSSR